jgi:hypothetical protein
MPRPIPDSLAAGFPEGLQPVTHVSEDTLRVLGGTGLPGDQAITRMDGSGQNPESGVVTWEVAHEVHTATSTLFSEIPEMTEFARAGIDFTALRTGYESYKNVGLEPELVFAPINKDLSSWRAAYARVRKWQDTRWPDSAYKLQHKSDGDGLYVNEAVAQHWDELSEFSITALPGISVQATDGIYWKVIFIPTASEETGGLAVNTSHDLSKASPSYYEQLGIIIGRDISEAEAHMPIGVYLTLQATRTLRNLPLLDSRTWTWNAGTFQEGNSLRAPASSWSPNAGRVRVNHDVVGGSRDSIGVRVPVWGES